MMFRALLVMELCLLNSTLQASHVITVLLGISVFILSFHGGVYGGAELLIYFHVEV